MGSKVEPYFILTAEKVTNPAELENSKAGFLEKTPPITPAPSGASAQHVGIGESLGKLKGKKKKNFKFVKYKVNVKEVRKRDPMNKKMELIKEKLEQSRERFYQMKQRQSDPDFKCEPTVIGLTESGDLPRKLDRSVSDMGSVAKGRKKAEGSFPYVYFVVSEDKITDEDEITLENGERLKSKSADKRRRVRIVEENRMKRDKNKDKQNQVAKIQGLARELGLKSSIEAKPGDTRPPTRPAINQIVFPGSKDQSEDKANVHIIHSPPRIPPSTPATTAISANRMDYMIDDPDDNVPRKPFLSGPMYAGKSRGSHSFSTPTFELPVISPEQKRRALGLGSTTRFDEFAFGAKPKSEQRQRRVTFADSLPIIRGSGFVTNNSDVSNIFKLDIPSLGGRAATMGSINLPSENVDRQSMCQKFLLGENVASARTVKKFGIPLPLPKIDIVSNVYDEMIIKMIQEYLQDSNTPTRQSHLAKELLVHLQKHNEHMQEMTVPNLAPTREKPKSNKLDKNEILKQHMRVQKLREMNTSVPPNTAEDSIPKVMTPAATKSTKSLAESIHVPNVDSKDLNIVESQNQNLRTVPYVQITFKNKDGEIIEDDNVKPPSMATTDSSAKPKSAMSEKSRDRANLCSVTPVSFQMAPPGLSKEDTMSNASIQLKA